MTYYSFLKGTSPLLIIMLHIGQNIPNDIKGLMTEEALLRKDTDWFIDKLYDFSRDMGGTIIKPQVSRNVIDLNRGIGGVNFYPGADSNISVNPTEELRC